jgi:hypothetical protein
MSMPNAPLCLSVVFVARRNLSSIQKILECLVGQSAAYRIEFLLSCDSPGLLREAEDFLAPRARFAQSRFFLHRTRNLSEARSLCVAEATGDAVAFTEDHCFPEPNWAEELLTAFESSLHIHAAAPVMFNPNPETAVSRVQFQLFFGRHGKDSSSRARFDNAACLPWHNTAYRRDTLVEALREVSFLAEGLLQEKIRSLRPHARFVHCTLTVLGHVNMGRLSPAMRQAYLGGRIFGSERAARMEWAWATKAVRFVLLPFVSPMVVQRSAPLLRDKVSFAKTISNIWIALILQFFHATGESVGACFGMGRAADAYADTECDRRRFLHPGEWPTLLSLQDGSVITRDEKNR